MVMKSSVNYSVEFFFLPSTTSKGAGTALRRGAKFHCHYDMCVLVAYKEESEGEWLDSGDNLTPNKGSVPSKFREMLVIKLKVHGINLNSLVGLMLFISGLQSSI